MLLVTERHIQVPDFTIMHIAPEAIPASETVCFTATTHSETGSKQLLPSCCIFLYLLHKNLASVPTHHISYWRSYTNEPHWKALLQILSMPALSPTMSQGNVASWQVTEGTEITAGDILADIETDKATLPWENQDDGFIAKLLKPSGSKDIPVGTPLVVLVEEKDHISDFKDFKPEGASAESDASGQNAQQTGL